MARSIVSLMTLDCVGSIPIKSGASVAIPVRAPWRTQVSMRGPAGKLLRTRDSRVSLYFNYGGIENLDLIASRPFVSAFVEREIYFECANLVYLQSYFPLFLN